MANRFIRPTITVVALTGLVAVGALYFSPALTQKIFTQKVAVQTETAPFIAIQPIASSGQIPADPLELDLLAESLKREQADQAAGSMSVIAPAAGDAQ